MTISIDVEKSFDKIQHPFIIKRKTLRKLNVKGMYLETTEAKYYDFTDYVIFSAGKMKSFSEVRETRQGYLFFSLLFNRVMSILVKQLKKEINAYKLKAEKKMVSVCK
jgi:hypothetical protein